MVVISAQTKFKTQDRLFVVVIDEFRRSSFLMGHMIFDDCVPPVGNGATMTYGYYYVVTSSTASFRAVNVEYATDEAKKQRCAIDIETFRGVFEIDHVTVDMGGVDDEVTFQM